MKNRHDHLKSIEQSNKHRANSLKVHRASSCQYWPQQLLTFALPNHISPQHERQSGLIFCIYLQRDSLNVDFQCRCVPPEDISSKACQHPQPTRTTS